MKALLFTALLFLLIEVAAIALAWDTAAFVRGTGNYTLSDGIRALNVSSGSLLAWASLAVWLHLFANLWRHFP